MPHIEQSKLSPELRYRPLLDGDDLTLKLDDVDVLAISNDDKRYWAGFAVSKRCMEQVLRLRYEVFNIELGEGLATSMRTGMDRDEYDDHMAHLVVVDLTANAVVGTYRLQTGAEAMARTGFYSSQMFDLDPILPILPRAVELGRACIHHDHRSLATLMALWKGIQTFVEHTRQRYLFGCCSIKSQDPDDGWRAMKAVRKRNALNPDYRLVSRETYSCGDPKREFDDDLGGALKIPKLFRAYLSLGVRVISEPAIDREFGTVIFLILLDGAEVRMSEFQGAKLG